MKYYLIKAICLMALVMTSLSIEANDYLKIYFKDGHTERHYMKLVESISATKYDLEGNLHSDYQMQQIIMKDTTYSYYIADIDSMSFRKVDEEQVRSSVESVQSSLEPILQQCSSIENLLSHIDEIKSIEGVENVYNDGKDIVIQIRDWFDIYIIHQPIPEDITPSTKALIRRDIKRITPTKGADSQLKVTIGFQMESDERFADDKETIDELNRNLSDVGYEPDYFLGEEMDLEFFYRRIFDSNLLLIDTHGGCGIFNNKHYLFTGIETYKEWALSYELQILKGLGKLGIDITSVDLDDIGISCVEHSDGKFFGTKFFWYVKEDFIRKSPYRFTGPGPHIVFIAACSSLNGSDMLTRSDDKEYYGNDSFAQVFFDKGADVYLGYNRGTCYSSDAAATYFYYLMDGASVEQSFNSLKPKYKNESNKDGKTELIDLYSQNSNKKIFLFNTQTVNKSNKEMNDEYKEKKQVELKGTSFCYDLNSGLDFGFRIATEPNVDKLGKDKDEGSENAHYSGANAGEVVFSVQYIPEPGKTYYYRACTFDGKNYNWGEERSFKIDNTPNEGDNPTPNY